jgi:hypothetical protein
MFFPAGVVAAAARPPPDPYLREPLDRRTRPGECLCVFVCVCVCLCACACACACARVFFLVCVWRETEREQEQSAVPDTPPPHVPYACPYRTNATPPALCAGGRLLPPALRWRLPARALPDAAMRLRPAGPLRRGARAMSPASGYL